MDDPQLLRYSRQILLPQVGIEGQQRLLGARVLIIGVGGLGSPVAMYLAASGVGQLVLVDHDKVELSNLQRQIVHTTEQLGISKVTSAQRMLAALNPEVQVTAIAGQLDPEALVEQVQAADAVVDCSDNFATRFALNRVCVANKTPLISGAAIRLEGQVAVFRPERADSPCYRCLYKDMDELGESCSQTGVLAPLVGIIGSIQATETIKVLLDIGETLTGRLLVLDALNMEWRSIKLRKDPDCPVCGSAA
jgi:molybdopterin/thiamine biosynthesis adenylyltransferase